MSKNTVVGFRGDKEYLEKIEQLSKKLGLDFSKTVRLCVDKMLEKYLGTEEEILLVDNKKWNDLVQTKLERFLENITEFTEFTKALTSQVKKSGSIQNGDIVEVTEQDLGKWIDEAITDDRNFETKDVNPEAQNAKTAILTTIRKLKGRID